MRLVAFCFATLFAVQRAHAACNPVAEYGCLPVSLFAPDGHDARLRYAPEFSARAPSSWSAGLDLHGTLDALRVAPNSPSTPDSSERLVRERLEATLRGSFVLGRHWSLHLAAPLVLGQSGLVGVRSGATRAIPAQALGDLRVGMAFRSALTPNVNIASRLALALPSSTEGAFAGGRNVTLLPDVSLQGRSGIVTAYVSGRARVELTARAPYDAPTTWAGAAAGAQVTPWGRSISFHSEFIGFSALQPVAPYAQDRSGLPRLDLPGQSLSPIMVSVGASGKGVLCNLCVVHASVATAPSGALAPAISAALRFEFLSSSQEGDLR